MPAHEHLAMGEGAEFDAIRQLLDVWKDTAQGIGDDAAVLDIDSGTRLVLSTDCCVERVHFEQAWLSPRQVGARATAAALSDLAAMGASPVALLVSFVVPPQWRASLADVARGIGEQAHAAGAKIVGGNISAGGEFSITTTVVGHARHPVSRTGARPGDVLVVTGQLGGPRVALAAHARGTVPDSWAASRLVAPEPRLAQGQWLAKHGATAMIDISDGLRADATHLARASVVDIDLDTAALPCGPGIHAPEALASGEEYELLATLPAQGVDDVAREFTQAFQLPLTVVGQVVAPAGERGQVREQWPPGSPPRVEFASGHDHFSQR